MLARPFTLIFASTLALAACSTAADDTEADDAASTESALDEGRRCGWVRQDGREFDLRCTPGYACRRDDGSPVLTRGEGTCQVLSFAEEGEPCLGIGNRLCAEGLLCDLPTRPAPGVGGRCKPKPSSGSDGGCCIVWGQHHVIQGCSEGYVCTLGGGGGPWCNGRCIAP